MFSGLAKGRNKITFFFSFVRVRKSMPLLKQPGRKAQKIMKAFTVHSRYTAAERLYRQGGVITPSHITKCRFLLKKKLYIFISRDADAVITF